MATGKATHADERSQRRDMLTLELRTDPLGDAGSRNVGRDLSRPASERDAEKKRSGRSAALTVPADAGGPYRVLQGQVLANRRPGGTSERPCTPRPSSWRLGPLSLMAAETHHRGSGCGIPVDANLYERAAWGARRRSACGLAHDGQRRIHRRADRRRDERVRQRDGARSRRAVGSRGTVAGCATSAVDADAMTQISSGRRPGTGPPRQDPDASRE